MRSLERLPTPTDQPPPRRHVRRDLGERLRRSAGRDPALLASVAVATVVGLVVRILSWRHSGHIDSDEAIVGLMAQSLLRDHEWPAMYWGQHYGGTLQIGPVAAALAVLPDGPFSLRLASVVCTVVAPVLAYLVGRRLYGRNGALVAAVILWCPPQFYAWFSQREMLFYQPTLVIGLGVLLLALRFAERPRPQIAAVIGLLVGLGLWMSTNIAYFAIPAGLAMVVGGRRHLVRAAPLLLTGPLGALPLLAYNLRNDWVSLRVLGLYEGGSFSQHLEVYVTKGVPMLVGGASPRGFDLVWRQAGVVIAVLLVAALVGGAAVALARFRPGKIPPVDALGLLLTPLVFAINPLAGTTLIPRYTYLPLAFVALAAGRLATRPRTALVATAMVVVLAGATALHPFKAGQIRTPLAEVEAALDRRGIRHVYADYWIGYRLAFESGQRILVTPFNGSTRRVEWDAEVAAAPAPAYVFVCNGPGIDLVRQGAARQGMALTEERAGSYVILYPSGNLPQALVAERLVDGDPFTAQRCAA